MKLSPGLSKILFIFGNIIAAFIVLILICYLVLKYLDNYTDHGKYIAVPSFENLTLKEAQKVAKKYELKTMVIDSVYEENAAPGIILEQYPNKGQDVKANRMIYLTINAQAAEVITFPPFTNAPYRQTIQMLRRQGFNIGEIKYVESLYKNLVLELQHRGQKVTAGTLLKKGSTIDIVLGNGEEEENYISMPNLKGLRLNDALYLAKENYLNIGEIVSDNPSMPQAEQAFFVVYKQEPDPDETPRVIAGSAVKLYITDNQQTIKDLGKTSTP
ncbi:MAG: PASTA domain-containing protein [Odoribacter sp.]|nr:PASTA domain-containing protein [Odoribacter sp.]